MRSVDVASLIDRTHAMTASLALPSNSQPRGTGRPGRLGERIYRDVGLAAVAGELELSADDLESELSEAVKRGARYIYQGPKSTGIPHR